MTGKPPSNSPQTPAPTPTPAVSLKSARDFGDAWTLAELWNSPGLDRLGRSFRRTRHAIDSEALVRIMVLNRPCDPVSKLGVPRWVQMVPLPGTRVEPNAHRHRLRAVDALVERHGAVEAVLGWRQLSCPRVSSKPATNRQRVFIACDRARQPPAQGKRCCTDSRSGIRVYAEFDKGNAAIDQNPMSRLRSNA